MQENSGNNYDSDNADPCYSVYAAQLITVNDGSNPEIPVSVPVLSFEGRGDRVITDIALPPGYAYKCSSTHDGRRNFISKLYYGDDYDLCVNAIGAYAGTTLLFRGKTNGCAGGILEVKADGNWTITISTITNTSTTFLQGTGNKVSGIVSLKKGNLICSSNHTGKRNFIVWIYFFDGSLPILVTNTIGDYSGQSLAKIRKNTQAFISIQADGIWTVDLGMGDDPCIVPDIN